MENIICINGIKVDRKHLLSKAEILDFFGVDDECGKDRHDLKEFLQSYKDRFGSALIFSYPPGMRTYYMAGDIIPIQEGYLYLPICDDPNSNNGNYIADNAVLLDEWSASALYNEFMRYAATLNAMLSTVKIDLHAEAGEQAIVQRDYRDADGNEYFVFYNPLYGYWPMKRDVKTGDEDSFFGTQEIRDKKTAQAVLDRYAQEHGLIPV
jgi:hypothetical protein